jgi:hypothetical protein
MCSPGPTKGSRVTQKHLLALYFVLLWGIYFYTEISFSCIKIQQLINVVIVICHLPSLEVELNEEVFLSS